MGGKSFKSIFPAILFLFCAALVLMAVWSPKGQAEDPVDVLSLETIGPLATLTSAVALKVESVWRDYFHLVNVNQENQRLNNIISRQNRQIALLSEEREENARLRELLAMRERSPHSFIAAKIIAWDPGPFHQSIIIDAGSADGIVPDAAVITLDGVVGRIAELSPHYAKVLLITDLSSGVDAFVARNRVSGLVVGGGPGKLSLDYVLKAEDVRLGDSIVSSGLDGIFPAGVPLGIVTLVDKMSMGFFMRAEISPQVELGSLEEVLIITKGPVPLDWLSLGTDVKALYQKKNQKK